VSQRRFAGLTAIVTGGSRSIGAAIAVALAGEGASVVVNYRSDAVAARAVVTRIEAHGGSAAAVRADVSDPDQARRLVASAEETFGPVDLLVNNAAVLHRTPVLRIEPGEWERVLATNLSGAFYCAQAAGRVMAARRSGAIVNVTSINDRRARDELTHYSVSKAGLTMLTKQLALELAPSRVRVNAVALGMFVTDMNRDRLADEARRASYEALIPLGELGQPADAVEPVLFLLSAAARLITGAVLVIDAGRSLT
jgi:NAD(P)-dependent dehydrogenase (short-subunit alcohol dehydrogenase family)